MMPIRGGPVQKGGGGTVFRLCVYVQRKDFVELKFIKE